MVRYILDTLASRSANEVAQLALFGCFANPLVDSLTQSGSGDTMAIYEGKTTGQ